MFFRDVSFLFTFLLLAKSSISTTCPYADTKFLTQMVDHFGNHDGTFQQQYQIVDTFYKPGGPILFYQGAENNQITCMTSYSLAQYANATGGYLAQLEHRYYGESLPFGNITSTLTYDWDYLTLDNVMMDSVQFVTELKTHTKTLENATVIVFGGSYGGYLTTMLRLNHGDIFNGAVASGFPLYLNGATFPHNSNNEVQPLWVNNVIQDLSKVAADRINASYGEVAKYVSSGKFQELATELNLCTPLHNETDVAVFNNIFSGGLQRLAQLNFPIPSVANVSFPTQYIINETESSSNPLAALKAFTSIYVEAVDPESLNCFNWTNGGQAGESEAGGIEKGPYLYMVCTYFPISMENTPPGIIFPAANATQYPCGTLFGKGKTKMFTEHNLATQYRWSLSDISSLTNFVSVYGQYDPITRLFPFEFPLSASRSSARKLFVSGMAHTGDMIAQSPNDPEALIDARNTIVQYILDWNS